MKLYFSDFFNVTPDALEQYGAFNVSLVTDLPLFVDPFLLFNSDKEEYQQLHDNIIAYLRFLRGRSMSETLAPGLVDAWYRFPEIKQTWLGFSRSGNSGRGLGRRFAHSLHSNLAALFADFGDETITRASHLEKLCLVDDRVGNDSISDFATNLIHEYLLEFTQTFAIGHIHQSLRRRVAVPRVRFNYHTETWEARDYDLPFLGSDHVLLTPRDILTKDSTWINRHDLVADFERIPEVLPSQVQRDLVNNYFRKVLPKDASRKDYDKAVVRTIQEFPELIDAFIRLKEDSGELAVGFSDAKVTQSRRLYVEQFGAFVARLEAETQFFRRSGDSYSEAMERVQFMKD